MADWQAGLIVLAIVPIVWGLMYLGWRARRRRQAAIPAPLSAPPGQTFTPDVVAGVVGVYVSTVRAGDWLDRIVVHGLGVRSRATLQAGWGSDESPGGLWWRRTGAPGLFVPAADLVSVRRDRGQAGKFTAEAGLIVVTWRLGEDLMDTAFRPRDWPDIATVMASLAPLLPDAQEAA